MNRGGRLVLLQAVLASAAVFAASAFTLEPMSLSLSPSGSGSIGTFRLKNAGNERVAIRLKILRRSMELDGTELNEAADTQFTIYPARLVLEPASTSVVKVQWKGGGVSDSELCFRLVAEQVPVDFSVSQGSGIKIIFRYIASLYITPPASNYQINVESAIGSVDSNGNSGFLVEVRNLGRRHVIAVDASFEFREKEAATGAILLSSEEIGGANGANYLPGLLRRFFIPYPDAVPGRAYEAILRFTPEK
jgi:fimbrial chaperone protein